MLNKLGKLTVVLLLVLTFSAAGAAAAVPENTGRLTVVGNAVVTSAPDIADITLGVETSDRSANTAARENAEVMEKVLAALKALGLTDAEISTTGYNIYSLNQTINRNTRDEQVITTYHVRNQIIISTKKLDEVGKIVDTAVQAGANQVQGIRFDLDNKQGLQLQALQNAIKQAKAKAEAAAESAGVSLRGIVSITEDYASYAPVKDMVVLRAAALEGTAETSITPGDVDVAAQVTIVFWF